MTVFRSTDQASRNVAIRIWDSVMPTYPYEKITGALWVTWIGQCFQTTCRCKSSCLMKRLSRWHIRWLLVLWSKMVTQKVSTQHFGKLNLQENQIAFADLLAKTGDSQKRGLDNNCSGQSANCGCSICLGTKEDWKNRVSTSKIRTGKPSWQHQN